MSDFFLSWQLWEQMTFCLACAMVLVVIAAMCRNAWDWYNLRKHVLILKEQQAEQARLLQTHPSIRQRQLKSQVPFGVRAIQSGVEVDGVWISRPNSVFNSPSNTSPTSPVALQPTTKLSAEAGTAAARGASRLSPNPVVAAAARQLEMQTSGGRVVPPRAAQDPFRDSAAPSERSARSYRSERSEAESQNGRKSTTDSAYRDLPDEEAGYAQSQSGASTGKAKGSRLYQTENAYTLDYFSMSKTQLQTYMPTRRSDQRNGTQQHNTYVPPLETSYRPVANTQRRSSYGYSYPQGYTQPPYSRPEAQSALPVEMDIGEAYDSTQPHLTGLDNAATLRRSEQRNSSYHMVFSNPAPGPRQQATPSAPQQDRSAPPGSQQQTPTPFPGQAVEMPPPVQSRVHQAPRDRAEAEAEASSMRRVNEGFSVARQGQKRDQESLAAAAREMRAIQAQNAGLLQQGNERETKGKKKLQKRDRRSSMPAGAAAAGAGSAGETKPSQFRENI